MMATKLEKLAVKLATLFPKATEGVGPISSSAA
jgi:hypothetical protein